MNRKVWGVGWLLLCLFVPARGEAATILPFSVGEMAQRAEKIFLGTCASVEESTNEYGLSVLTITFRVQDALKGTEGETVTFKQLNPAQPAPSHPGEGGLRLAVPTLGLPSYARGEEALLFLSKAGNSGLTSPVGITQGKMAVTPGANGEKRIVNKAFRAEPVQNPAIPSPGEAGSYAQFVEALRAMLAATK